MDDGKVALGLKCNNHRCPKILVCTFSRAGGGIIRVYPHKQEWTRRWFNSGIQIPDEEEGCEFYRYDPGLEEGFKQAIRNLARPLRRPRR